MDPRLREYYERELQHLHEMGAEFANQHPKIAARLGMRGIEVADPYVERLLEGVGFLAARIQLKLDAEFPRFTQRLLEMVYPHYLAPTPAMLVAQINPELTETNLATGFAVPRGSLMHGMIAKEDTACDFRTSHEVTLWPIQVAEAKYFSFAPDLPLGALPDRQPVKGGVRLKLRTTAGLKFNQIGIDRLRLYLSGADEVARKLYELAFASPMGAMLVPTSRPAPWFEVVPAKQIYPAGFADDEALLPVSWRSFQGYRLLQEYFSFPERFLFVDVAGLRSKIQRCTSDELELVLLFGRGDPVLEKVVDASNFSLFCTPVINLFPKRADRVPVSDTTHEFHVVPDRTRPMDFEVYTVTGVTGYGVGADSERTFLPFYAPGRDADDPDAAYFTLRRERRLYSDHQKRSGNRTSYIGTEIFLSLVDPKEAPYSADLRQLAVTTLCTNRDLALMMPLGLGKTDLVLDVAAPVSSIRVLKGPSRPYAPLAEGATGWRFVSHLSLNHLSLADTDPEQGAAALKQMLELYAAQGEGLAAKQLEGIKSVRAQPITRRLPVPGPITFGRGLHVALQVDEVAFEAGSAFLLAAVLEQFFARHVSINSFTETSLRSATRGEVMRWLPRWGERLIL
ncbi:MAG TPA: type VI secretion system baseplate subunit TssF [Burkholderiales bacterium]|nr:type VI secretion system baseplate subunit TssF [Burkholderiales bacterium]